MEKDKRPFYIWLMTFLTIIGGISIIFTVGLYSDNNPTITQAMSDLNPLSDYLYYVLFVLGITVIPIIISKQNFRGQHYIGFGIPFITIAYAIWHNFTCTGKLCNLLDLPIGISALIFAAFYALGIFLKRSDKKIVTSIVLIETIITLLTIFIAFSQSNQNYKKNVHLELLEKNSLNTTNLIDFVAACDAFPSNPYSSKGSDCWYRAIKKYPNEDVCGKSKNQYLKEDCLFQLGLHYRYNLEFGCEENESSLSFDKKDDPSEKYRLIRCWSEKRKIYPELNMCQYTYEWNQDKCNTFFKTVTN